MGAVPDTDSLVASEAEILLSSQLRERTLRKLGLSRRILVASGIRKITKKHMVLNDATPHIEVDPETYEVRADGEALVCEPAAVLPMAQRYFLF